MKWKFHIRDFGVWSWTLPELANGWAPMVTDDSQMYAPKRKTQYVAAAVSRERFIAHPLVFTELKKAKNEALKLALDQRA